MTLQNVGDYDTGLEEFGMEDAVIPRLTIVQKEAEYKDSLSGEQFPKLRAIILGLVKQRSLWHETYDDGDWPMCRSADHANGYPNVSDEQPKNKRFPWDKAGFNKDDFMDADGNLKQATPCSGCALKEWGSHPDGSKPYCAEQFTLPVLYDPREDDNWVPAILTFQKTSLKPLKAYLSSFARTRGAAFEAITEIGLDAQRRGTTDYAVAKFRRIGNTDESEWRAYSTQYRGMADFLRAAPGSRREAEEGVAAPSDNTAKAPEEVIPPKAPEEKPAAAAAPPVADDDDDDLPF